MSREVRKEQDWWGNEKEVVYEGGHKVGEVRTEETWGGFGPNVQRTYSTDGKQISETRREETWGGFGPNVQRTYNTDGKQISETRREETWGGFGPTVQRTDNIDGERISETRREETWGGFGPTVKREYDTERKVSSNRPHNGLSKYAAYGASPPTRAQTGTEQISAAGIEGHDGSAVRCQFQGAGEHKNEHRQDHRKFHVRDHR